MSRAEQIPRQWRILKRLEAHHFGLLPSSVPYSGVVLEPPLRPSEAPTSDRKGPPGAVQGQGGDSDGAKDFPPRGDVHDTLNEENKELRIPFFPA